MRFHKNILLLSFMWLIFCMAGLDSFAKRMLIFLAAYAYVTASRGWLMPNHDGVGDEL